eukprot:6215502-Prymnesium_polylepis.2
MPSGLRRACRWWPVGGFDRGRECLQVEQPVVGPLAREVYAALDDVACLHLERRVDVEELLRPVRVVRRRRRELHRVGRLVRV